MTTRTRSSKPVIPLALVLTEPARNPNTSPSESITALQIRPFSPTLPVAQPHRVLEVSSDPPFTSHAACTPPSQPTALVPAQHHLRESHTFPEQEEGPGCGESLGGLFNHLLVLQHLSTLLSQFFLGGKKKNKICPKQSMIRFANFKLITVCKISCEKTGYQHTVSDSFPAGAAGLEPALPAL